jgi:hypothetical protein
MLGVMMADILSGMNRRGFFGLLTKAMLAVAASKIPFVSPIACKAAEKYGWLAITINGQKCFIPIWR